MLNNPKAQFAMEFFVLVGFMFLIFVGFIAITTTKILESKEKDREEIAEDITAFVKNEIVLAKSVTNGYSRTFSLPSRINGNTYTVEIIGNRELVVNYVDKEFLAFLPENICGDILIPNNEIDKENGVTCLNSNFDQTQCQNAQNLGICEDVEELLPGTICCCWFRYGLCGPP